MQFPEPVCSRLRCDTPVSSLPPAVSSIYHNSSHVTAAFLTLKVQLEAGGAKSAQRNPKAPLFPGSHCSPGMRRVLGKWGQQNLAEENAGER